MTLTETRGYVTVAHGQLHYRRYPGNVDRPTLVLLHQSPSSSLSYRPLVAALDGAFACVAFDTPGFGMSDPLPTGAPLQPYGNAIREGIEGLGLGRCHLFGHHTGAGIAIQLAHDHPEAVVKLCLSGPPLLPEASRQRIMAASQPMVLAADGSHLTTVWDRHLFYVGDGPLDLVHQETVQNLMAARPHEAYAAMLATDFIDLLGRVTIETLVTAGEGDTLIDGVAQAHAALPNSTMQVVPDAGLHLLEDAPGALSAMLIEFYG